MDDAAANAHLKTVKFLHSDRTEGCTAATMNNTAGNGHLAVVEYLHTHRKEGCTVRAMNDAAANGHLEVIKYLHETQKEGCTTKAMDQAATNGQFDVVRFLHASRDEGCTAEAMNGAIRSGHLTIMELLHREKCYHGDVRDAIHVAMTKNHTAVVGFVCQHYDADICADSLWFATAENLMEVICLFEELKIDGWTVEMMDRAADVGCLEAVQHLHSHRREGCTTHAVDHAAAGGHLNVVKFLHENRSEGCTKRAMNGAAEKGALNVLQYLRENRSEGCTSDAIISVVLEDHVEVVRFLVDHCDVACPDTAILYAARIGNWEMLELLFQANTCDNIPRVVAKLTGWGHLEAMKRLCELTETSATGYIHLAAGNGHWHVVKYLLPMCSKMDLLHFNSIEAAACYGDVDMVNLIASKVNDFMPQTAHRYVALGDFELFENWLFPPMYRRKWGFLRGRRRERHFRIGEVEDVLKTQPISSLRGSSPAHSRLMMLVSPTMPQ